jgi:CHAD domain-containing protein
MRLVRGTPLGRAVRGILRELLGEIRRQERRLRREDDPEGLHDFRVALRRTRSVLGQVEGAFAARTRARFRLAFRRLGRSTGPLRDLDVQLSELPHRRRLLPPRMQRHLDPLAELLRERRRLERERLLAALATPRHAALL